MQGNMKPFYQISISMLNVQPEEKNSGSPLLHTHRRIQTLPPFGKSDHNSILLIPAYKQKLKQEAPVTRSIKNWSDEADAKLQDCFAQTGICSGIPPVALRSTPYQSLASSISASMMLSPQ
jgi:hypothetical protein